MIRTAKGVHRHGGAQRRGWTQLGGAWGVLEGFQEEVMSKLRPKTRIGVRQVKVLENCSRQRD